MNAIKYILIVSTSIWLRKRQDTNKTAFSSVVKIEVTTSMSIDLSFFLSFFCCIKKKKNCLLFLHQIHQPLIIACRWVKPEGYYFMTSEFDKMRGCSIRWLISTLITPHALVWHLNFFLFLTQNIYMIVGEQPAGLVFCTCQSSSSLEEIERYSLMLMLIATGSFSILSTRLFFH
jgi:hypothetical protein